MFGGNIIDQVRRDVAVGTVEIEKEFDGRFGHDAFLFLFCNWS
jgi:hypothetical protein